MSNTPHRSRINVQEVRDRNRIARATLAGLSAGMPRLSRLWLRINVALDDVPALATEIETLAAQLSSIRHGRANLAAAARATLRAHGDNQPDHLWYIRDELRAQGDLPPDLGGRS